ncbi:MAG: hypothetical protein IPG61_08105 [bacterium]|nr:hypothetical protein [bacterium]
MVISAPFADGPGNSRSGAGEVAVVWGRALWPAQVDLRTDAAVIIYGDHAGDRLMARCTVRARGADYDDLLLFAPLADAPGGDRNGSGLGYVVRGSSNWMPVHDVGQIARQTIVGASPNGALSHGAFLDLNEDGDFEILCGSYLDPGVDNQRPDGGVLHIVPTARVGTMVDLATDPCWQVLSAGAQDWLTGYGAMQLGDVDDDGRAELLIAASRAEGITGVGAVYAFEPAALLATDPSTIDLAPVDLDLAGEFTTESRLTVSYAVRQTGIGTATGTVWHDRVVFSRNSRLGDADDLILEDVEVAQPLQPGMEYRSVVDVPLSALMAGNGHIGLLINADASVPECLGRDNNSILQSVVITAPTREPDPDRSTVPAECLIGPDESATLFVILRDENGEPIPHLAGTFLDFEGVEGLRFCVPPASWPILKGSKSDSQGRVRFLPGAAAASAGPRRCAGDVLN